MEESQSNGRSGEIRNFGLLIFVLLIVVLVVALSRPFIFGKVIPAVLGDGTSAVQQLPDDEEMEDDGVEDETAVDEDNEDADSQEADDEDSDDSDPIEEADTDPEGEADDDDASEDTADDVENPEDLPTSVPTIEYVVQRGDTLTSIAKRFDTEIFIIVEANGLVNPNRLLVGSTLLIPQPE